MARIGKCSVLAECRPSGRAGSLLNRKTRVVDSDQVDRKQSKFCADVRGGARLGKPKWLRIFDGTDDFLGHALLFNQITLACQYPQELITRFPTSL